MSEDFYAVNMGSAADASSRRDAAVLIIGQALKSAGGTDSKLRRVGLFAKPHACLQVPELDASSELSSGA